MRVSGPALWAAATVAVVAAIIALSYGLRSPAGGDREPAGERTSKQGAPQRAAAFADSVGVNIHLTYDGTPYADFQRVLASLRALEVRHVRDGLVPHRPDQYDRLNRLAAAGIRSTLIMGAPNLTRAGDQVETLKAELSRAVEAIEGPNEYDLSGDPQWADALRGYQRELFSAVNDEPQLDDLPVYGPTIVMPGNRAVSVDVRGALDVANIHPYAAGGPPEPAVSQGVADADWVIGNIPVVATETGYHNALHATQGQPPVDELTAADYLPRLFLSAFDDGIRRTYWYELVDLAEDPARTSADSNFGLLRHDFSPKPAFAALTNLMRLVRGGGGDDPSRRLRLSISAPPDRVRRLLLQKRDGVYLLALWRPVALFDPAARRRIDEPPVDVRVELPRHAGRLAVYRPSRSAQPVRRLPGVDRVTVPVAGDAVIVELSFR
jgi:hypothetical protein